MPSVRETVASSVYLPASERLVLTVAKELRRSGGRYALATQCIGAGMGISTILERMD